MEELIGGTVANVGEKFLDYGLANMMMENEQANYRKNQQQNFELSQQAQKNAASNTVEGLKRAGLSPALAAGMPQAAPMASAPMQNKALNSHGLADMFGALSTLKLQKAQEENLNAQTEKQKILNNRMASEDDQSKDAMLNVLNRLKESYKESGLNPRGLDSMITYLESPDSPYDAGRFAADLKALDFEKALSKNLSGDIDDALETLISQKKISEDVAFDIANMSHSQRRLLAKQVELAIKEMALISAQTSETSSRDAVNVSKLASMSEERKKLQKEQDFIEQEAKRSKATTDNIKNGDFRTQYSNGDYFGTVRTLGLDGLHSLLTLLGILARQR